MSEPLRNTVTPRPERAIRTGPWRAIQGCEHQYAVSTNGGYRCCDCGSQMSNKRGRSAALAYRAIPTPTREDRP